jgi:hypothetical protein
MVFKLCVDEPESENVFASSNEIAEMDMEYEEALRVEEDAQLSSWETGYFDWVR